MRFIFDSVQSSIAIPLNFDLVDIVRRSKIGERVRIVVERVVGLVVTADCQSYDVLETK